MRDEDEAIAPHLTREPAIVTLQENKNDRRQFTATAIAGPTMNEDHQQRLDDILSEAGAVLDSATPHEMARRSSLSLDDAMAPQNTAWESRTTRDIGHWDQNH